MNENFDIQNIRAVFKLAERARSKGNNPFAARLVSVENELLLEAENTQVTDGQILAHAEMNLLHEAVKVFDKAVLQSAILYTSAEPCGMCSGAIFWSGVSQLVFGLSGERLHELVGRPSEMLLTSSRDVLRSAGRKVQVRGPFLGEEAEYLFNIRFDQPKAQQVIAP